MNKWGRIVSANKYKTAKKEMRLQKHGFFAEKGKFGAVTRKVRGGKDGDEDGDEDGGKDDNYIPRISKNSVCDEDKSHKFYYLGPLKDYKKCETLLKKIIIVNKDENGKIVIIDTIYQNTWKNPDIDSDSNIQEEFRIFDADNDQYIDQDDDAELYKKVEKLINNKENKGGSSPKSSGKNNKSPTDKSKGNNKSPIEEKSSRTKPTPASKPNRDVHPNSHMKKIITSLKLKQAEPPAPPAPPLNRHVLHEALKPAGPNIKTDVSNNNKKDR
jgi:hypothetical protein